MKSLNIVFPEKNKIELWEEDAGVPGPEDVLCEARRSLLSTGTEITCLKGVFDPDTNWEDWVRYPFHPGYSMAAEIIEAGGGVKSVKSGDRVFCYQAHTQRFVMQPQYLHLLPEGVSYEEAVWAPLAVTTQVAVRRAELKLGETVGVVGLGMLGQLIIQYLRLSGAKRIIAVDTDAKRLETAKAGGATHTLAMDAGSAKRDISEITGGRMLDAVFDVTGHPAVLAAATQLLRKLGRLVLVGDTSTPSQQRLGPGVVSNSISILGIHGTMVPQFYSEFNQWTLKEMVSLFFEYILQGRMNVRDLTTCRYIKEAPEIYRGLLADRSGVMGIVFDWNQSNNL